MLIIKTSSGLSAFSHFGVLSPHPLIQQDGEDKGWASLHNGLHTIWPASLLAPVEKGVGATALRTDTWLLPDTFTCPKSSSGQSIPFEDSAQPLVSELEMEGRRGNLVSFTLWQIFTEHLPMLGLDLGAGDTAQQNRKKKKKDTLSS